MPGQSVDGTERFEERPDACPLCDEEKTGLDFHHWCYTPEIGCYLCSDCHAHVHGDGENIPSEDDAWKQTTVENLVQRHLETHPEMVDAEDIYERYNIPDTFRVWDSVEAALDCYDHTATDRTQEASSSDITTSE